MTYYAISVFESLEHMWKREIRPNLFLFADTLEDAREMAFTKEEEIERNLYLYEIKFKTFTIYAISFRKLEEFIDDELFDDLSWWPSLQAAEGDKAFQEDEYEDTRFIHEAEIRLVE